MWNKDVLVLVVLVPGIYSSKTCPENTSTNESSRFTGNQGTESVTVRLGHYTELRCCATSFNKIHWYKQEEGSWEPFKPVPSEFDPLAPTLSEDGQILEIKSAREIDGGQYKCVLDRNGNEADSRVMSLNVAECDELARGPYPIAPLPCDTTSVTLGGTVTLPCNGYFGCGDNDLRTVTWFVTEVYGQPEWRDASLVSDRYQIKYFKRNGNSELGANLTISNIKSEDLDKKFMCLLSTPQVIKGESKVIVRLQHDRQKETETMVDSASVSIILAAAGGTMLVVAVVVSISCIFHKRSPKREHRHTPKEKKLMIPKPDVPDIV